MAGWKLRMCVCLMVCVWGGGVPASAALCQLPNHPTSVCPRWSPPTPPLGDVQVERFPDLAAEREAWEKEQAAKRRAGAVVSGRRGGARDFCYCCCCYCYFPDVVLGNQGVGRLPPTVHRC